MERVPSNEKFAVEVESQMLAELGEGDKLEITTQSGSWYEFTIEEYVNLSNYPELAFAKAQLHRESEHQVNDDPHVSTVVLEGGCTGKVLWESSSVATGRAPVPEVTVGKSLAYRNTEGMLIATSKVTAIKVIKAPAESRMG